MAQCIPTGGYLLKERLLANGKHRFFFICERYDDVILYTSTLCSRINCLNFDRRSEVSTVPMSAVKRGTEVEKNLAQGRGIFRIDRKVEVQERRTGGREKSIDLIVWSGRKKRMQVSAGRGGPRKQTRQSTVPWKGVVQIKEQGGSGRERERRDNWRLGDYWAGSCERQVACPELS